MTDIRYPIGPFEHDGAITDADIERWIDEIEALPAQLEAVVKDLTPEQLDTPYRPEGWTVRQVVHHVADSHLNSLVRFKWALTEDTPTIKAYYEDRWARLADYQQVAIPVALDFITLLHARWVVLLRSLDREALSREFVHPESGLTPLDRNVGIYAWHGRHHLAHITSLSAREGWG